jgi:hypothetical protein
VAGRQELETKAMERIRLDSVAFDAGTQIRAAIDQQVVSDYAEAMSNGATFPPIVLFHDGNKHYLADGFHRFMAAQRNQFRDIDADVRAGTREDAVWFGLGANRTNGKHMTTADKRHAVEVALTMWPDRSASIIAEQIGCSKQYVAGIRNVSSSALHLPDRVTGTDGRSYPASPSVRVAARERATQMVREGATVEDVKRETGVGRDTLNAIRREAGAAIDKSRSGVADRRARMRAMAKDGYTSRQIAADLGLSEAGCRVTLRAEGIDVPADRAVGKIKRHDSNRIVAQIVADAENLSEGLNLVEYDDLDRTQLAEWLRSLQASREKLGSFIRRLMKEQQRNGEAA